jgi:hypothetical protein
MRISLLLSVIVAVSFLSCNKPSAYYNDPSTLDEFKFATLSNVSVYDTLPKKAFNYVSLHQLNGIKALYPSGKSTTYFEYEGEASSFLRAISTLPFKASEVSDTFCRKIEQPFSLSGKQLLSDQEINAASFFWGIDPVQYTQYECVKGRQRHTILISNNDGRILHRIETNS